MKPPDREDHVDIDIGGIARVLQLMG